MDDLHKTILEYVVKEYMDDDEDLQITIDTELISGGIVDSFSMVSLKRFLENRYKIQIPDKDATPEAFDTVTKIAALVQRYQRA